MEPDRKAPPRNDAARWRGRPVSGLSKLAKLRATPSPLPLDEQNRLAGDHLPLAKSMARGLARDNPRWADELESAAGMALVQAARRYDPSLGTFGSYAGFRIGMALADVLRRSRPERNSENWLEPDDRTSPVGSEIESLEALDHVLRNLPPKQAQLCRLAYRDGLSQVEIARQLGISRAETSRLHALSLATLRGVKGIAC
jgi:RNA polymerase sigma factor (sigma-70 family)